MDFSILEIVLFLLTFLLFYKYVNRKNVIGNLPPGPIGLPLIGALYLLGPKPYISFENLTKKWGNTYSFNFASFRGVVVNDLQDLKDIFIKSDSANGRPFPEIWTSKAEGGGNQGVMSANGHTWSGQRRYTMKTLRDFGFGRKTMEDLILFEVQEIVEKFDSNLGKPIDIKDYFNGAVLNAIWGIVSGDRNDQNCPKMAQFYKDNSTDGVTIGFLFFFPWVLKIEKYFGWICPNPITSFLKNSKNGLKLMRSIVEEHKKTYDEDVKRDFVDVYLGEISKTNDSNSNFFQEEGERNLVTIMYDLFQTGSETTSTALLWALHVLALNQTEQRKLYEEIKNVGGLSTNILLEQRKKMPYCEAFLHELFRFICLVPLTFRCAVEDIKYKNYIIPKGTPIMGNVHSVLISPEIWTNPDKFEPERFLSPDGKTILRKEGFYPFGLGKRNCLGESLAWDQLFLFLTNIIQKFQVIPDPSRPIPTEIKSITWGVNLPTTFPIVFNNWSE